MNATIVDVKAGKLLSDRLIAITGDTIKIVEEAGKKEQYEAQQVLDVQGKYVMPGLWDMHVHFRGGDTLIQENKNMLPLFLAFGITTVRDGGGDISPAVFQWREQVKKGELDGPTIFTSGPKLDGTVPAWPGSIKVPTIDDIAPALDSLQKIEADYVKIYDGSLSKEVFYGIIKEAEARGLRTTGHMPMSAYFTEAVDEGLDGTEHMYYVVKACSPLEDSLTQLDMGYGMMGRIIDTYDTALANEVFDKMKSENVFITPTLYIVTTLANIPDVDHSKDTLLAYIGPGIQQTYKGRVESAKRARAKGNNMRSKMEQKSMEMILPMYKAGIEMLAGSDCGPYNSFVYPGESLHGELKQLTEAGLTPAQALETSFINGPEFFGLGEYYGSIEKGKVADIIILDEDPLKDITNASKIFQIIKAGKIYDRAKIEEMLLSVKNKSN